MGFFRAFGASLAAENAARLASMQRAQKNIEENLAELTQVFHSLCQNPISAELLEVLFGFEALTVADS